MKQRSNRGVVLDSSAVLAYVQDEPGEVKVQQTLNSGAVVSTVNLAEVYAKTEASDLDLGHVRKRFAGLNLAIYPFTEMDSAESARLYGRTRIAGLSLGDRACLALARRLGLPVLTADRAWARIAETVAVEVQLIR